jgi:hypothetical protein
LRRLDESAEIVVLERDHYVSFEEPRGTQGTAVVKVFDMTAGGTGMTEVESSSAVRCSAGTAWTSASTSSPSACRQG